MEIKLNKLSHLDKNGRINMVDVSGKPDTARTAVAKSEIKMKKQTLDLILSNDIAKGSVLETSKIAGIAAAKKTWDLIPLCHNIRIGKIDVNFKINEKESFIEILCTATASDKTGIEMEALTGSSIAALTIYDMCKAYDKEMKVTNTCLLSKTGGKSGDFFRSMDE